MAGRESTQDKLSRVRAPRVHITYKVETGKAIEIKELPFVMGVLGNLSGSAKPLTTLKERKFVEINPDNFDSVLKGMTPRLSYSVDNKLSQDANAGKLAVNLKFEKMDDFSPENVANQIEPLKQLLEFRSRLADLRSNIVVNPKLAAGLDEFVESTLEREKEAKRLAESGSGGTA